MAISAMQKILIISHRSEAPALLETLQQEGICQILNAEQAVVSRDYPELSVPTDRPRDIEQLVSQLGKSIAFLQQYSTAGGGLANILAPRAVIDERSYEKVVSDESVLEALEESERVGSEIDRLSGELENLRSRMDELLPWQGLTNPVEDLGRFAQARCIAGLVGARHFAELTEELEEAGAAIQVAGTAGTRKACLVVCLNETAEVVQKLLRSAEFESFSFGNMTGTVAEAISDIKARLERLDERLGESKRQADRLSGQLLDLKILHDHYSNMLTREQKKSQCPATDHAVVLEGWVRTKDYKKLESIVGRFEASAVQQIDPAEGEEIPVEIENKAVIKPFEVITRLYGMPQRFEVDPTVFLAPFFALFFGLCLTDAGYGIVIFIACMFLIKKMQADKKMIWMLAICSVATIFAGALMGGWFGDAVQKFIPSLEPLRQKVMWFDPMEYPLRFFILSLILGYIQIMAGLMIAFLHDLKQGQYIAAICDRLSWLVMLNSIVAFVLAKTGKLPGWSGPVFGYAALLSAGVIFLFSQREGGWAARLGMGFYNLFSAIFYVGDVLSYLRLMALGLVTAGLAMAVNQIAKLAYELPIVGFIAAILILVFGHLFNLSINALGAFVHSLRLQYAEFFPKFFAGGGWLFRPLGKDYKYIHIRKPEIKKL